MACITGCGVIVSPQHRDIIDRALAQVPQSLRADAEKHILDRLRGVLQIEATDVRRVANSALAKYSSSEMPI
jgi:hypothetical protein